MGIKIDRYHDIRVKEDKNRVIVWKEVARYLQRHIPPDSKIVELGAGKCLLINNLKATHRIAVDLFEKISDYAAPGVSSHIADCTKLPFIDSNSIDVVLSACFFEHLTWENIEKTINEVNRTLKSGGTLIVIIPNYKYNYQKYFDDYTHRTVFTHISFSEFLIANGFKIIECHKRFLPDPGINIRKWNFTIPLLHLITRLYLNLPLHLFSELMLIVAKK